MTADINSFASDGSILAGGNQHNITLTTDCWANVFTLAVFKVVVVICNGAGAARFFDGIKANAFIGTDESVATLVLAFGTCIDHIVAGFDG